MKEIISVIVMVELLQIEKIQKEKQELEVFMNMLGQQIYDNRKRLRKEENLSANDIQQQRVPLGATTGSRPSPKRLVFISPLLLYCQMMNTSEMLHPTRAVKLGGKMLVEKVHVATMSELCAMSSQHHT
ncbi:Hypothetical predicted protein [Olea europaea subsp. europaea]|uniref:Uncharacterized protein n=1 Tax=Olea europaea subsp. europaea TaxID=158383 RepID=A0A8S0SGS6_OLEEU|nr:Hypothetical predicted protein [Olea europaea subsp. europaea]